MNLVSSPSPAEYDDQGRDLSSPSSVLTTRELEVSVLICDSGQSSKCTSWLVQLLDLELKLLSLSTIKPHSPSQA